MHKLITPIALFALAGAANAGLIASFSYENLDSSYDAGDQVLSTTSMASSSGSVSRLISPAGDADFGSGSADFLMELNVSNVMATTADGSGSLVAFDLNGDSLTADVSGSFSFMPLGGAAGIVFFDGMLQNVAFNDVSGDGEFNGDTSSFGLDFSSVSGGLEGALQRLQISDVGFFDTSWSGELAEVDGQIVPTPGVLGLMSASGLFFARRRR